MPGALVTAQRCFVWFSAGTNAGKGAATFGTRVRQFDFNTHNRIDAFGE
jgi:hypothetical protein